MTDGGLLLEGVTCPGATVKSALPIEFSSEDDYNLIIMQLIPPLSSERMARC